LVIAATMLAAQSIQLGINDVVVAGGMESMSNAPKYIAEARLIYPSTHVSLSFELNSKVSDFILKCRKGSRFGHDSLVDGMLKDGLWDVYNDCAMGSCAELCADKHEITREEQVLFKPYFFLFQNV
jgi:acetyl-CoA C-acetyltransferase